MILYLDTSAIVKLYIAELGSQGVREAVGAADVVAASRVAFAETAAALSMAHRVGRITESDKRTAITAFGADWRAFSVVDVGQGLVALAAELADTLALRGFDAIHLASAVLLRQRSGRTVHFAAWDHRLTEAAAAMDLAPPPGLLPSR